jgi:hypothetical protein
MQHSFSRPEIRKRKLELEEKNPLSKYGCRLKDNTKMYFKATSLRTRNITEKI